MINASELEMASGRTRRLVAAEAMAERQDFAVSSRLRRIVAEGGR